MIRTKRDGPGASSAATSAGRTSRAPARSRMRTGNFQVWSPVLMSMQMEQQLWEALDRLDADRRVVMILRHVLDIAPSEIADISQDD